MSYTYEWPRPGMTVDVVLFSPDRSHVLTIVRSKNPYAGFYGMPGGFMNIDETLKQAAVRELKEETSISINESDLRLVGIYDQIDRDSRSRVISTCFTAQLKDYRMPTAGDDAAKAEWIMTGRILHNEITLAFDHKQMLLDSFELNANTFR